MRKSFLVGASIFFLLSATAAQEPPLPPGDREPVLRLEAGGPTSFVTALAFSPDGRTLYAAGFDKVVRTWTLDRTGRFVADRTSYRVPIGAGLDGAINAMALSPDGTWLAAGGLSIVRGGAGVRLPGLVVDRAGGMTTAMWLDQGTIYVFNTTNPRDVRLLRGHKGPIVALAFAPGQAGKPPVLASMAREWDDKQRQYAGVARVWDVSAVRQIAGAGGFPDLYRKDEDRNVRPGLAVWHTGRGERQLRVAFALEDGLFRLWDVEAQDVWKPADGAYNNAVARLAGDRTLTASFAATSGQIGMWQTGADGPELLRRVTFPPPAEGVFLVPRALVPFASRSGGEADRAAVALRVVSRGPRNKECLLQVVNLETNRREGEPLRLWVGADVPTLAAAPGGKHLAVAGNKDHEIRVYEIADLLKGLDRPQKLASVGATHRYVSFVTKDKSLGLLLNETAEATPGSRRRDPARGDVVFDIAQRTLTDNLTGWKTTAPDLRGWEVEYDPTKKEGIAVKQDGRLLRRIDLKGHEVDDYALLPGRPPLLAVAFREAAEPRLYLYDLSTGDQLRQYTAHTDRIRCLAFSGDGKLLASVAEDQTICVWSLAHLDKILGQHGMLKGVGVKENNEGKPVVASVEAGSPARGKLNVDELIEGLVVNRELKPLASPRAFYEAIAGLKPGTEATLRVRDAQGQARNVNVTVGQGVDERKPLFSLFITRAGKVADREWVGWNPYGPYEASSRPAERHIGWHFNTGDPKAPAAFALADQYRKDRYKEGILRHLAAAGSLAPALKAWEDEDRKKPAPKPEMNIELDELGPEFVTDQQGHVVLRTPPKTLRVSLDGGFPERRIANVRWQLGQAAARDLDKASERRWEADLTGVAWQRGVVTLRVTVHMREAETREYTRELSLRYQPPAPALEFDPAWLRKFFGAALPQRLIVREGPRFSIEAAAKPGADGEKIKVSLRHGERVQALEATDGKIKHDLELKEGENVIELSAVNDGALRGFEELETSRRTLMVTYVPDKVKVPPPLVLLEKVVTGPGQQTPIEVGRPVVVTTRTVRIRGKITAEENLAEATRDREALAGFKPDTHKEAAIDDEVTLRPGRQEVRFAARTKNGGPASAVVVLEYRPPLPQVVWTAPPPSQAFFEGEHDRAVTLKARILDAEGGFQAVLLHNGKPLKEALVIDKGGLTAGVKLHDGDNRFQVRLTTDGASAVSEELLLRYLRPPRDIVIDKPKLGAKPLTDLVATAVSVSELTADGVEATVNGRSLRPAEVARIKPGGDAWRIVFKDVPLDRGDNEVRLFVSNREARCRQPGVLRFAFAGVPAAPPSVRFLEPAENVNVTGPELLLRFRVQSSSPLKRVELLRDGDAAFRLPFDVSALKPDAQGNYELTVNGRWTGTARSVGDRPAVELGKLKTNAEGAYEVTLDLQLERKENRLRVVAVNEGGEAQAGVVVNYVAMPVRLVIDHIQQPQAEPIRPEVLPGGRLRFPATEGGQVTLRGRLLWDREKDEQLKQVSRVRVFVNGFQQRPALLKPAPEGARERAFEARLLLNHEGDNLVEIDLPDNSQEVNNRPQLVLECRNPVRSQRQHLLIISVGEKDRDKLLQRAKQAFQTPAFIEPRTYFVTGYVSREKVFTQLCLIKRTIDRLATQGSPNDVVMVYYEGVEALRDDGHYIETSLTHDDPDLQRSGISLDGLAQLFPELLGAQLLLLDVARPAGEATPTVDRVIRWPEEVRTGVFRSAWLRRSAEVPEDARLLRVWAEAPHETGQLKEKDSRMARLFSEKARSYPTRVFFYDRHLPVCLENLAVDRGP